MENIIFCRCRGFACSSIILIALVVNYRQFLISICILWSKFSKLTNWYLFKRRIINHVYLTNLSQINSNKNLEKPAIETCQKTIFAEKWQLITISRPGDSTTYPWIKSRVPTQGIQANNHAKKTRRLLEMYSILIVMIWFLGFDQYAFLLWLYFIFLPWWHWSLILGGILAGHPNP